MVNFDSPPQAQAVVSSDDAASMHLTDMDTTIKKEKSKNHKTKAAAKKKTKSSASKQQQNDNLKDRPKRAHSAYNIFFATERQKMLADAPVRALGKPRKSHGKVGFAEMAKRIGSKWKNIDPQDKLYYEGLAAKDKWRYNVEMGKWTMAKQAKRSQAAAQQAATMAVAGAAHCDA
jgi:hypothetical protein